VYPDLAKMGPPRKGRLDGSNVVIYVMLNALVLTEATRDTSSCTNKLALKWC